MLPRASFVDDGSTDHTQDILKRFPWVRNVRQKNMGLSYARNVGMNAAIAQGRRVHDGVRTLVVPGSMNVKAVAEAEGLHEVFIAAGFVEAGRAYRTRPLMRLSLSLIPGLRRAMSAVPSRVSRRPARGQRNRFYNNRRHQDADPRQQQRLFDF